MLCRAPRAMPRASLCAHAALPCCHATARHADMKSSGLRALCVYYSAMLPIARVSYQRLLPLCHLFVFADVCRALPPYIFYAHGGAAMMIPPDDATLPPAAAARRPPLPTSLLILLAAVIFRRRRAYVRGGRRKGAEAYVMQAYGGGERCVARASECAGGAACARRKGGARRQQGLWRADSSRPRLPSPPRRHA